MFQASKIFYDVHENATVFYNSNKVKFQKEFQSAALFHGLHVPICFQVIPRLPREKYLQESLNQAWREIFVPLMKQRADLRKIDTCQEECRRRGEIQRKINFFFFRQRKIHIYVSYMHKNKNASMQRLPELLLVYLRFSVWHHK